MKSAHHRASRVRQRKKARIKSQWTRMPKDIMTNVYSFLSIPDLFSLATHRRSMPTPHPGLIVSRILTRLIVYGLGISYCLACQFKVFRKAGDSPWCRVPSTYMDRICATHLGICETNQCFTDMLIEYRTFMNWLAIEGIPVPIMEQHSHVEALSILGAKKKYPC